MGRAPCCDKANVKRGPWSPEEDAKLKDYIENQGTGGNWIALPQKAGIFIFHESNGYIGFIISSFFFFSFDGSSSVFTDFLLRLFIK